MSYRSMANSSLAQLDPKTGQPMSDTNGKPIVVRAPNFRCDGRIFSIIYLRQMKQHASFLLGFMELDMQRYASAEFLVEIAIDGSISRRPYG